MRSRELSAHQHAWCHRILTYPPDGEKKALSRAALAVPFDGTSRIPGARFGPESLLRALDESTLTRWRRMPFLGFVPTVNSSSRISLRCTYDVVMALAKCGCRVLALGGDHSVTLPIMEAYSAVYHHLFMLVFDAHADAYRDPILHNWTVLREVRERTTAEVVVYGLREGMQEAKRSGIHTLSYTQVADWNASQAVDAIAKIARQHPIYVSIDIDVIDPSAAPGVSSRVSGGLTPLKLLSIVESLIKNTTIVGFDVVEFNPLCDIDDLTLEVYRSIVDHIVSNWE